jgi:rubrerythrin
MEKYGVQVDETLTKHAREGECPTCGSKLDADTNPPKCPKCGHEPFEPGLETDKKDGTD